MTIYQQTITDDIACVRYDSAVTDMNTHDMTLTPGAVIIKLETYGTDKAISVSRSQHSLHAHYSRLPLIKCWNVLFGSTPNVTSQLSNSMTGPAYV